MASDKVQTRTVVYDDDIVRAFSIATIVWGAVAFLVGVLIASQLSFWQANFGLKWLTFSRLRPLHTNAAIFAFVGNMMFAGVYYSTQRLLKARMASGVLSWLNFWGWQLIIVSAALTLPFGLTQGKEYAELIWPIDIAIAVIWVVFAVNFFWTIARRNEKNLYVALWFYIATIVTIAVLHIVNSLQLPDSFLHSYPIYAGVQDALVQWWYGHNAVAFFLTTPMLGIMYYFIPKSVERPVYSYRLSVVHFWSLVFIYIWAGPHHLLYTALPDWAQTLGMVFSVMLWAPSWGGMLNGLLTLRGAWDKLRTDPVVKFFVVAVTFYGMSTFEGPLLSIKSVSALGHYTDWIIGHVHGGALGWNGFLTFGMLYWLVPRLWKTELWSKRLAETHFWLATLGILLYVVAMWISGVSQGLFWRALDADGFLKYPDFVEGLLASRFMYQMRLIGGTLYFLSYLLAIVNYVMTIRQGSKATYEVTVPALTDAKPNTWRLLFGAPVVYSAVVIVLAVLLGISGVITSALTLAGLVVVAIAAILTFGTRSGSSVSWHRLTEANSMAFTVLVLLAILVGGIVEIIPTVVISKQVPTDAAALAANPHIQQPYSPLELEGRDLYVREGCYVCHSQMIRPFRHETLRYGDYSRMEEFIYDHPFQWGSKRTGPDLHREGGKYANLWHYLHMQDPRSTSPGSNMPSYAWLKTGTVDFAGTGHKMETLSRLGVPYTEADIASAKATALSQAGIITADLSSQGVNIADDSELVALIGYLQRLGRGPQPTAPATGGANAAAAPDTVSVGEGS
ncbi:MAG: cytochrome-c oxidase, cbb3-type subunit I [Candidatus Latescibacteria bacterium]|nr:cytochrome-c oxidase, cbb3-type subunit I [Candidatus Latescibacterota bacterium]MCB9516273.1 cytochrome-c oxidase, cbb3-type subunit I [Candidatus Latescibacterota bacterium]